MQGYVTLATGSRAYLEQALNLILSLKLNDPKRPACLITDDPDKIPAEYRKHIDDVQRLEPKAGYHGCLNKLLVQAHSPFSESVYVDADCIVVKPDMDRHWEKLGACYFGISAEKKRAGTWYGFDIAEAIRALGIEYIGSMNSGVFYFREGAESAAFFATAQELVETHKDLLGSLHRNKLQLADEPFIGAAIGMHRIEPADYRPGEDSIMVTTVAASQVAFDPFRHVSEITKNGDFALLGRFLPRRRVRHSPSIAHFVKLRPAAVYQSVSDQLRDHFGVERFSF